LSSDGGLVIVFVFFLYVIRVFFGLSGGFLYFLPPPPPNLLSRIHSVFVGSGFLVWLEELFFTRGAGGAREWRGYFFSCWRKIQDVVSCALFA
jgi:hypothetical protein